MRLLQLDSEGELSLTSFSEGDIPPYAILSHTWAVADDEVTFDDIQNGSGKSKAGYAKIRFCGEEARRDGLQYFWVDTCCIDKSSNAELQESIISLFRYYRNSARCYVYLSDVGFRGREGSQTKWPWKLAFRASPWFTLAWTLQDLLAPSSVKFFSLEGEFLGDKNTLGQLIHEITGIPIAALHGASLSDFSVEERMSWAKQRRAMRKEDKAYSLLGIFDVYMPILYGEGEEKAFARLMREIEYSKQSPNRQVGEDYDELASVRSVESLGSTATGSSATLVNEVLAAANEFAIHLLQDQALTSLFSMAFDLIPADRIERNIRRLLKLYAIDLRQEARSDIEKEAVQLILTRARYVAYRVRQCYDKSTLDKRGMFEQLFDLSPDKRALLENYLRGRTRQPLEASLSDGNIDDHASDSGMSDGEEADESTLNDLEAVKAFMFESAAYYRFKQKLKDFIRPNRGLKQQNSTRTKSPGFFSFDTWGRLQLKTLEIIHGLRMLSRPLVPPGHKRITWICGCGDYRYADVLEDKPNGASTLQAILRRSVVPNAYGADGANSNDPQPPAQAPPPGNPTAKATSQGVPTPSNRHATGQMTTNNAIDSSAEGSANTQSDQMFLLLCLTVGGVSHLEQLGIQDLGNDQYLFAKIRERYHELHTKAQWHQKLSMTRWLLSNIGWLSLVFNAIDLTTANSIEFVRFQLVPIAMDIRPWNFHSPSLPPEVEVRVKKTYHYHPCPYNMDPTCLNGELLHCLWKPGRHFDRFWLNFFPKKLNETLQYVSSKPEVNTAWGVRVVEGVNWASVTCLAFILFTISAILGIIYSAVTHDVGGGFAISAFLGTLPALGIASLHLTPIR